jgi:hypothetical protein
MEKELAQAGKGVMRHDATPDVEAIVGRRTTIRDEDAEVSAA